MSHVRPTHEYHPLTDQEVAAEAPRSTASLVGNLLDQHQRPQKSSEWKQRITNYLLAGCPGATKEELQRIAELVATQTLASGFDSFIQRVLEFGTFTDEELRLLRTMTNIYIDRAAGESGQTQAVELARKILTKLRAQIG